jgi:hypothetical protein
LKEESLQHYFHVGQRVLWNRARDHVDELIREYGKGPFTVCRTVDTAALHKREMEALPIVLPGTEVNPYGHRQLLILKNRLGNILIHRKSKHMRGMEAELSGGWFIPDANQYKRR